MLEVECDKKSAIKAIKKIKKKNNVLLRENKLLREKHSFLVDMYVSIVDKSRKELEEHMKINKERAYEDVLESYLDLCDQTDRYDHIHQRHPEVMND